MSKLINIAVVGLGQVGNYLLNELNTKKKDIELKTGKKISVVAVSARNINIKRKIITNFKSITLQINYYLSIFPIQYHSQKI